MKASLLLLAPLSILVSCARNQGQVAAPPAAVNQFGIPEATAYTPETAQYQPVDPINPPALPARPTPPPLSTFSTNPAPVNTGTASSHLITRGDSLWGISRKYGVSVEALQAANNLTGSTIIAGRNLIIPGR